LPIKATDQNLKIIARNATGEGSATANGLKWTPKGAVPDERYCNLFIEIEPA